MKFLVVLATLCLVVITTRAAAPSIEEGISIETLELEEDETPMGK